MRNLIFCFIGIVSIGLLAYGGFLVKRWFNYEFGYEKQVEETVKTLVKNNCLKNYKDQ